MYSLSFQLLKERIEVLGTQFDMDGWAMRCGSGNPSCAATTRS